MVEVCHEGMWRRMDWDQSRFWQTVVGMQMKMMLVSIYSESSTVLS